MSELAPFCFGQAKFWPVDAVDCRPKGPNFGDQHGFFGNNFPVGEYDIAQSTRKSVKLVVVKSGDRVNGCWKAFPVRSRSRHNTCQLIKDLDRDVATVSFRDVRLLNLIFDVSTNHVQFGGVQNLVAAGGANQEAQLKSKRISDGLCGPERFRVCRIDLVTWPFSGRVEISDVETHGFTEECVGLDDLANVTDETLDAIAAKCAHGATLMANSRQHRGVWASAHFEQGDPSARLVSVGVTVIDDAIDWFEVGLTFGFRLLEGDHFSVIMITDRRRNVRSGFNLRQRRRWRFYCGCSYGEPFQKYHAKIHCLELHGEVEHCCAILATEGCLA
ncbi:MAG: hypothetical protein RLQ73_03100 [Hoeflea sp. D1-CHI-28]